MKSYPSLTTKRLILDQIKPTDIPDIVRYASNKKIEETTRTMPFPYFEEDAITWIHLANQGFIKKDHFIFAIRNGTTGKFMGGIGLHLNLENNRGELGYWLAENFWNNGYTTEATKEIIRFGFEILGLNKISAVYLSTNTASGKVMIKNQMIKEAEFKDHDIKKGTSIKDNIYVSLLQYRLTKKEYEALN